MHSKLTKKNWLKGRSVIGNYLILSLIFKNKLKTALKNNNRDHQVSKYEDLKHINQLSWEYKFNKNFKNNKYLTLRYWNKILTFIFIAYHLKQQRNLISFTISTIFLLKFILSCVLFSLISFTLVLNFVSS